MTDLERRVRVSHTDDGARSRVTVFFRIVLLIPHLIWFVIWSLASVVLLPLHWLATLIRGRALDAAHGFYSAFVTYALSLYSYWYLAADRYPSFLGEPGYVVAAEIPPADRQRRWTVALRLFLALPPLILVAALTNGLGAGASTSGEPSESSFSMNFGLGLLIAFFAWFASLALGRTPRGLRDAQVYCLGYAAQAYAYLFLLTDRHPTSDPRAIALDPMPDHPLRIPAPDDDRARTRLLVLFRFLLAIPHFVWLTLWGAVALVAAVVAWLVALAAGRVPGALHRFLAAYVRYWTHVTAFVFVLGRPFPGFVGRSGSYPVDAEIDPPARQSRWRTLLRLFLALPALFLAGAFSTVTFAAGAGAWFAALFTGRVPEGLHRLLGWTVRYQMQAYGYLALLTDRYPYTGPDGSGRAEPVAPPPAGGPEAWGLPRPARASEAS
jgi:hypothetical protein